MQVVLTLVGLAVAIGYLQSTREQRREARERINPFAKRLFFGMLMLWAVIIAVELYVPG